MSRFNGVPPPPEWYQKANPFLLVYAPYSWPGYVGAGRRRAVRGRGPGGLGRILAASTVARLRRAVLPAESGRPAWKWRGLPRGWRAPRTGGEARRGEKVPGPSLDGNPVLWREWHRSPGRRG